jgi:hypothetical protein
MKLRATQEGRKIEDVAASLLVSGLAADSARKQRVPARKETLKFPLFPCAKNAPARKMSIAQLLAVEQAAQTHEDLERLGFPL